MELPSRFIEKRREGESDEEGNTPGYHIGGNENLEQQLDNLDQNTYDIFLSELGLSEGESPLDVYDEETDTINGMEYQVLLSDLLADTFETFIPQLEQYSQDQLMLMLENTVNFEDLEDDEDVISFIRDMYIQGVISKQDLIDALSGKKQLKSKKSSGGRQSPPITQVKKR